MIVRLRYDAFIDIAGPDGVRRIGGAAGDTIEVSAILGRQLIEQGSAEEHEAAPEPKRRKASSARRTGS